jgi:hypothetical protein
VQRIFRIGLLIALFGTFATMAQAQTFTQTIPVPGESLFSSAGVETTVPSSILVNYPKFDSALGTLTQVNFAFNYDFVLTLTTGAAGGGGSGSAGGPILINGNSLTGAGDGSGNGAGPFSTVQAPFSVTGTYDDSNLANYLAAVPGETGTFDFQPSAYVSPNASVTASLDLLGTSHVTVTYAYAVPESTGVALVGLTLLGWLRAKMDPTSRGSDRG